MSQVTKLEFAKIIPGGNPTILLANNALTRSSLPSLAQKIMNSPHLQAEQVGRIDLVGSLPHLEMMGGEFCINATRSAAALLAHQGMYPPTYEHFDCLKLSLTVSGYPTAVPCLLSPSHEALMEALAGKNESERRGKQTENTLSKAANAGILHVASRISCHDISIKNMAQGVYLVEMPGISHLLLDENIYQMPANWQAETASLRTRYNLNKVAASGVIWFKKQQESYSITPAIFVAETASECLETACGSGTLALALASQNNPTAEVTIPVRQPSGETLYVHLCDRQNAWVSGCVSIIATGTLFI